MHLVSIEQILFQHDAASYGVVNFLTSKWDSISIFGKLSIILGNESPLSYAFSVAVDC